MTTIAPNVADVGQKKQRKIRSKAPSTGTPPALPSLKLVASGGGKPSSVQALQDSRNDSIERAIAGVKSALKAGHHRAVRPQVDNATAVKMGTREIYSRDEIMVRMRFRALQLADAFFEKCMRDMAEPRQLHYHKTGDNCVENWMPSSGASSAISSMTLAANMLLNMAERTTMDEKELVVALSCVKK